MFLKEKGERRKEKFKKFYFLFLDSSEFNPTMLNHLQW